MRLALMIALAAALLPGCNTPQGSQQPLGPVAGKEDSTKTATPPANAGSASPLNASAPDTRQQQSLPGAAASSDPVLARLNGKPITLAQIEPTLINGYGLNILLNVVQLELAKQEAARAEVTVSPEDIAREREQTLAKMFPDAEKSEIEPLFEQFLQQQHISRPEFDLVLQTNTYLRKVAEPLSKDKIGDAALQEAFRQLYGETVQVRHIQVANMQRSRKGKCPMRCRPKVRFT
jgi:hypothetical protein